MNTHVRRALLALTSLGMLAASAVAHSALKVGDPLPGRYIVVLKDDAAAQAPQSRLGRLIGRTPVLGSVGNLADELLKSVGGETLFVFGRSLNGFLAQLTPAQAEALKRDPRVSLVEPDRVVSKRNPTWGQDRIDQRALPLDQRFEPGGNGAGVHVYVIDTGLRGTHEEVRGRVGGGANFAGPGPGPGLLESLLSLLHPGQVDRNDWNDCNGHGTHVAGSAVGARHGVARGATVYGVRVLGCDGSGSNSGVIAGIDWVLENHRKPAVANLSLGGGNSEALDRSIRRLVSEGVTTVVAAGNDNADACSGSPNRVREAITVGATDRNDARASFSNWGRCVDIFAPGHEIPSAWYQSDTQIRSISGTSMAAPHVAGAAALLLAADRNASPQAIGEALQSQATSGALSQLGAGSPNRLLHVGGD
jgi:serine protease